MTINKLWVMLLLALPCWAASPARGNPVRLPISFEGNRFFAVPVTTSGVKLRFYTDSGGGLFVTPQAVKEIKTAPVKQGDSEAIHLPEFQSGKSIPAPLADDGLLPVYDQKLPPHMDALSGLLGQQWFAERTWTWDYIHRELLWRADGDLPKDGHHVQLGFKSGSDGKRELNFARISITVDAQPFNVLFDTGATTYLKPAAWKQIDDGGPEERATSFIIEDIFNRWHREHPAWKYVDDAEDGTGQPMIQVPEITVAGYKVGPVWFTRRPNQSFHKFMSQFMDKQVEGALGGSGLHYFIISVDYPNAVAVFQKP